MFWNSLSDKEQQDFLATSTQRREQEMDEYNKKTKKLEDKQEIEREPTDVETITATAQADIADCLDWEVSDWIDTWASTDSDSSDSDWWDND